MQTSHLDIHFRKENLVLVLKTCSCKDRFYSYEDRLYSYKDRLYSYEDRLLFYEDRFLL